MLMIEKDSWEMLIVIKIFLYGKRERESFMY